MIPNTWHKTTVQAGIIATFRREIYIQKKVGLNILLMSMSSELPNGISHVFLNPHV